jgi:hypothetical protein
VTVAHPDALHTTEQAAAALEVPARVIRVWAHRKKIAAADSLPALRPGGRSRPLYRLDQLLPLAERYHSRKDR